MKIKYLLSGLDSISGFSKELIPFLKEDIKGGKLVIVSSTFEGKEKNDKYYEMYNNWFKMIGIYFNDVVAIDSRMTKEEAIKNINSADVVFLSGGDTLKQMSSIEEYDLIYELQERTGITIGLSAGSINMATNVVLVKDIDDNVLDTTYYKGIGLVDINIEPHFNLENEKYNKTDLYPVSMKNDIICLTNESAIRVSETYEITYIGNCYLLSKGNIRVLS